MNRISFQEMKIRGSKASQLAGSFKTCGGGTCGDSMGVVDREEEPTCLEITHYRSIWDHNLTMRLFSIWLKAVDSSLPPRSVG